MKVLISHSWKDKTTADLLARDLAPMAEVWLDIRQLRAGQHIDEEIEAAIAAVDLIVLVWSAHAAGSDGVAHEIGASLARDVPLVPCLFDDTPLPAKLRAVLAVDFRQDYTLGFGRLCIALLRSHAEGLGLDVGRELAAIQDAEGVLTYVQDYRNRQEIAGEDRDHWMGRIATAVAGVNERVRALQQRVGSAADYVQRVYDRLQTAGTDPLRVRAILHDVIRNDHLDPALMAQVRAHIESYLATLPEPAPEPGGGARAPTAPSAPAPQQRRGGATAAHDAAAVREALRPHVPAQSLDLAAAAVQHYIETHQASLDVLRRIAAEAQSAAGAQVVQHLQSYLDEPHDLLPEAEQGALGLLDDAWLVHNTAYRVVEAGFAPASAFPVAWDRIVSADALARALIPPLLLAQLDNALYQLLSLIAREAQAYSPAFTAAGTGYHAGMARSSGQGVRDPALQAAYDSAMNAAAQASLDGWSASLAGDGG